MLQLGAWLAAAAARAPTARRIVPTVSCWIVERPRAPSGSRYVPHSTRAGGAYCFERRGETEMCGVCRKSTYSQLCTYSLSIHILRLILLHVIRYLSRRVRVPTAQWPVPRDLSFLSRGQGQGACRGACTFYTQRPTPHRPPVYRERERERSVAPVPSNQAYCIIETNR